jgi:hypothetical protein
VGPEEVHRRARLLNSVLLIIARSLLVDGAAFVGIAKALRTLADQIEDLAGHDDEPSTPS